MSREGAGGGDDPEPGNLLVPELDVPTTNGEVKRRAFHG